MNETVRLWSMLKTCNKCIWLPLKLYITVQINLSNNTHVWVGFLKKKFVDFTVPANLCQAVPLITSDRGNWLCFFFHKPFKSPILKSATPCQFSSTKVSVISSRKGRIELRITFPYSSVILLLCNGSPWTSASSVAGASLLPLVGGLRKCLPISSWAIDDHLVTVEVPSTVTTGAAVQPNARLDWALSGITTCLH